MKVTLSRGATINLGNYESARIDLTIEGDDVVGTGEGFDKEVARLDDWLKRALTPRVQIIQKEAGLPPHPVTRFTGK